MERPVQTQFLNPPNYHNQKVECGCQNCYYMFEDFDLYCQLHYALSDNLLIPNCSSIQNYYVEDLGICNDWKPNWEVIKMTEVVRKTGEFILKSENGKEFQVLEYTRYQSIKDEVGQTKILLTTTRDPVRPAENGIYEILTESGLIKATLIKQEAK